MKSRRQQNRLHGRPPIRPSSIPSLGEALSKWIYEGVSLSETHKQRMLQLFKTPGAYTWFKAADIRQSQSQCAQVRGKSQPYTTMLYNQA